MNFSLFRVDIYRDLGSLFNVISVVASDEPLSFVYLVPPVEAPETSVPLADTATTLLSNDEPSSGKRWFVLLCRVHCLSICLGALSNDVPLTLGGPPETSIDLDPSLLESDNWDVSEAMD